MTQDQPVRRGQQRDREAPQRRFGRAVVLAAAAAGALTSFGGAAYAGSTPSVVATAHLRPLASKTPVPTARADLKAFLSSGYTYSDAEQLAALWDCPSVGSAKLQAGAKLLAGQELPIPPAHR